MFALAPEIIKTCWSYSSLAVSSSDEFEIIKALEGVAEEEVPSTAVYTATQTCPLMWTL
jgi:hypothetical protein